MWVFTDQGFFSVVEDWKDPTRLYVRARVRDDLKKFLPNYKIVSTPERDYPFRVRILKTDFALKMSEVVRSIAYPNFKDRVRQTLGAERERQCHRVWNVMRTPEPVRVDETLARTKCKGYGSLHVIGECSCFR